jgi:hemolysin D
MNQKPGPLKKVQSSLALRAVSPQEVRLRPAPIWSQALIWTIIGTASLAFVYAIFAKIDEVILAPGELQPLGAERPIKAPFAGVVKDILVKEGQAVSANQPLVRLDPDVSGKRADTLREQIRIERVRFTEESRSIAAREQSLRERTEGLQKSLQTEQQFMT